MSDSVTITGVEAVLKAFPGSSATLTGTALGLKPGETDWAKGNVLATIPATTIKQDRTLTGLGSFKTTMIGKISYGETLKITKKDGTTITTINHTVGKTPQTATIDKPADGVSGINGYIPTGVGTNNLGYVAAGLVIIGFDGIVTIIARRKKTS